MEAYKLEEIIKKLELDLSSKTQTREDGKQIQAKNLGTACAEGLEHGVRDNTIFSFILSRLARGISVEEVTVLANEFALRCKPPFPESEVMAKINRTLAKFTTIAEERYHLTDMGNAQRLARLYGNRIRISRALGALIYDETRWVPDDLAAIQAAAKDVVRLLYIEAGKEPDEERSEAITKSAIKCESAGRIDAMIRILPSEPRISVLPDAFDQNPLLLNVLNGTIDLQTGELRPHNPDDLITRIAPVEYDEDATCQRWEQFISEITDSDDELGAYIQRVVGYCLTGLTTEQAWFFLWSKGSNGKSVFINTISEVLGDYAVDTPASTFMEHKNDDGPRNDLARLRGARFVSASEPKGQRFDPETIKKVSGDGKITARFLRKEFFEFTPEAKVFICANNRPEVRDASEAFWRRIQLIPFSRQFTGKDRDNALPEKLKTERPGVLNWMLEGRRQWQLMGLNPPDTVKLAVQDYRQDADRLGDFLDKYCAIHLSARVPVSELYKAYQQHCEDSRERPLTRKSFNENLLGRAGIAKKKDGPANKRVATWFGIGLRADCERENVIPGNFSRDQRSCESCDIPPSVCVVPPERRNAANCEYFQPR